MASYVKEKNGSYTIRYRQNNEQKSKRGFKRLSDAKKYYENEIVPSLYQEDTNTTPTALKMVYTAYLANLKAQTKESSYVALKAVADAFVIPLFGDKDIFAIKSIDVIKWQNELDSKGYSYKYKCKIRYVFNNLLLFARHYGLKENPFAGIKAFKEREQKAEMLFWTKAEFEQFIAKVDNEIDRNMFALLYLSGCRKGEMLALTWKDIDFKTNILKISKTYTRKLIDTSAGYAITAPKTRSAYRDILLPPKLITSLMAFYEAQKRIDGFTDNWFLFNGLRPFPEVALDRKLARYCALAEVKKIRLHDFRHSHASLLINAGQNILVIAQRLGHSNIEMTLNTYSHLFPNSQTELLNSLNLDVGGNKSGNELVKKGIKSPQITLNNALN